MIPGKMWTHNLNSQIGFLPPKILLACYSFPLISYPLNLVAIRDFLFFRQAGWMIIALKAALTSKV